MIEKIERSTSGIEAFGAYPAKSLQALSSQSEALRTGHLAELLEKAEVYCETEGSLVYVTVKDNEGELPLYLLIEALIKTDRYYKAHPAELTESEMQNGEACIKKFIHLIHKAESECFIRECTLTNILSDLFSFCLCHEPQVRVHIPYAYSYLEGDSAVFLKDKRSNQATIANTPYLIPIL